ncbi:ribbon-helix-helix domain-containing protein [Iningainema tapete]
MYKHTSGAFLRIMASSVFFSYAYSLMPTKRPRTTISFDPNDYKELEEWAESEFRSVPQLITVIVKKALIERKNINKESK